ncbi:MAG: glucose-1-phosphate adenylyltransferase subunit GlgD [Acidobacteriota bacterium]|nr:glucose-1-phosphate adenylyltransferase subunit GlgD [Acidobacteriota bacterium]
MFKEKVLAIILAGGKGSRLGILTENRAKPVMPFGGSYRLIDFALSNCVNSKISDVWVIEQYELHSLNEHLSSGRPWDLDRTYGGLQVLPPFENETDGEGGFAEGNADAIYRHIDFIEEFKPDILIVLSADHVYKMDFRDAIKTHLEKKAAVTMVTTRLPKGESASRFGVVETDKNGRIKKFDYKPEKPDGDLITTEIFVYDAKILQTTLKDLSAKKEKLKDYGDELLPLLVEQENVFEHRLKGYWRDVGTVESYWQTQMELLDEKERLFFDDEHWRILTLAAQRVPAFIYTSADVKNSLLSSGCKISGNVSRSVLSSGVIVEKGAEIADSIVLPDAMIEKGVKLKKVIVDAGVKVSKDRAKKIEEVRQNDKNVIIVVGKRKIQNAKNIED